MKQPLNQSLFFRGVYEFQDPSGSLLCARVPLEGMVDLYDGTGVIVRPNQCALFVHKGQIADILLAGTHTLNTENIPVLTKLVNIKFGFKSPIRSELYFFSGSQFVGRRWGTSQPVMLTLSGRSFPIRAYGNYNVRLVEPKKFYLKLMSTRGSYSISETEELIQGQLLQLLPEALQCVTELKDLSVKQSEIASRLETLARSQLDTFGFTIEKVQVLSVLPSKEILQALDASAAMEILGDQREYLLYKAASSLDSLQAGGNSGKADPMHMMMGLMLGKNLIASDYRQKEGKLAQPQSAAVVCKSCGLANSRENRFCPKCGKELA